VGFLCEHPGYTLRTSTNVALQIAATVAVIPLRVSNPGWTVIIAVITVIPLIIIALPLVLARATALTGL
jgi:hypothetical protein